MKIVNRKSNRRPIRTVRHTGVVALAKHLGLSAGHVCRVLRGARQSAAVMAAARKSGLIEQVAPRGGK